MSDDWDGLDRALRHASDQSARAGRYLACWEAADAVRTMLYAAADRNADTSHAAGREDRSEQEVAAERASDEVWLLAELASSVVPWLDRDVLNSRDLSYGPTGVALRLLRRSGWSLDQARAAALDGEVAAVLHEVQRCSALLSADADPTAPGGRLRRVIRPRLDQTHSDRLLAVAEQLPDADGDIAAGFLLASQAVDEALNQTREFLTSSTLSPPDLPVAWPTARRQLIGEHLADVALLEDTDVADTIVDLVATADRRVLVAVPWVSYDDVLGTQLVQRCVAAARRGLEVVFVTRPIRGGSSQENDAKRDLVRGGVTVRWSRYLHDKAIVVDDTAVVGSMNFVRYDLRRNPNSAIGTATVTVVDAIAERIRRLAGGRPAFKMFVLDRHLPVWTEDERTDETHRLVVADDADDPVLEGSTRATVCGLQIELEQVVRWYALSRKEHCQTCVA